MGKKCLVSLSCHSFIVAPLIMHYTDVFLLQWSIHWSNLPKKEVINHHYLFMFILVLYLVVLQLVAQLQGLPFWDLQFHNSCTAYESDWKLLFFLPYSITTAVSLTSFCAPLRGMRRVRASWLLLKLIFPTSDSEKVAAFKIPSKKDPLFTPKPQSVIQTRRQRRLITISLEFRGKFHLSYKMRIYIYIYNWHTKILKQLQLFVITFSFQFVNMQFPK